jgi:hypothetical protein
MSSGSKKTETTDEKMDPRQAMMAKLRALGGKKDDGKDTLNKPGQQDEKQAAKPNYFSTLAGIRKEV